MLYVSHWIPLPTSFKIACSVPPPLLSQNDWFAVCSVCPNIISSLLFCKGTMIEELIVSFNTPAKQQVWYDHISNKPALDSADSQPVSKAKPVMSSSMPPQVSYHCTTTSPELISALSAHTPNWFELVEPFLISITSSSPGGDSGYRQIQPILRWSTPGFELTTIKRVA